MLQPDAIKIDKIDSTKIVKIVKRSENGDGPYIIDQHLSQRVGQVLLRSDDVRHVHGGVIDGDTEIVDRQAVAPEDDEVPQGVRGPRYLHPGFQGFRFLGGLGF